jgi:hypothetical protein
VPDTRPTVARAARDSQSPISDHLIAPADRPAKYLDSSPAARHTVQDWAV